MRVSTWPKRAAVGTVAAVSLLSAGSNMTWACDSFDSGEIVIQMRPMTSVDSDVIPLESLLTAESLSCLPSWADGIEIARFDQAPVKRLSMRGIQSRLNAARPEEGRGLVLTGPEYVLVKPKLDRFLEPSVIESATEYLANALNSRFHVRKLQLRPLFKVRVPRRSTEDVSYAFSWRPALRPMPMETVWVEGWSDGRRIDAFPLQFEVEGELRIYRTVHPVFNLNSLHERLLEADYTPIESVSGAPLDSVLDGDWQFTRDVPVGSILMADMLRPRPAIVNGEFVKVQVNLERVGVEALSIATTDAQVGDWVRLRSLSSNEFFEARVIGRSLAIVDN